MKILICGYIGGGNCGDEAICDRLVSLLKAGGNQVTLLSLMPAQTAALHHSPTLPRYSPRLISEIRGSDLFILGGGTLLQEESSKRSPLYYLGIGCLATALGTPWVLMGGIDPLRGFNRRLAEGILPHARVALMRSDADLRRLKEIAPDLPTLYLPDTALLPFQSPNWEHSPDSPPIPYVIFCPKNGVPRSILAPLVNKHRKEGRRIIWLALSREDEENCALRADQLGGVWIRVMPPPANGNIPNHRRISPSAILPILAHGCAHRYFAARPCEVACRLIAGADAVYSARLHGLIFAKKVGKDANILPDGTKQWKLRGFSGELFVKSSPDPSKTL